MPMNPRKLVPTQEPGILDFAPGAAAAYSLRNLSLSYSSPVVTVRRSTDSAEADFTATEVSDGTLAAWCSGGDGFVKQWWSQTGSNHAEQTTAGYQPKIVDSGSLVTEGGKAAIKLDGVNDYFTVSAGVTASSAFSAFAVLKQTATRLIAAGGYSDASFFGPSGSTFLLFRNTADAGLTLTAAVPSSMFILSGVRRGTGANETDMWIDGAISGTGQVSGNFTFSAIGARYASPALQYSNGTISELLIYPTDQTALRTRIEGNLAWTYNS